MDRKGKIAKVDQQKVDDKLAHWGQRWNWFNEPHGEAHIHLGKGDQIGTEQTTVDSVDRKEECQCRNELIPELSGKFVTVQTELGFVFRTLNQFQQREITFAHSVVEQQQ